MSPEEKQIRITSSNRKVYKKYYYLKMIEREAEVIQKQNNKNKNVH